MHVIQLPDIISTQKFEEILNELNDLFENPELKSVAQSRLLLSNEIFVTEFEDFRKKCLVKINTARKDGLADSEDQSAQHAYKK